MHHHPARARARGPLTAALAAAALLAAACSGSAPGAGTSPEGQHPSSTCFWAGPYVREDDATNFALLDTGAVYWTSSFTLPEDARLRIRGDFAHGRYQSFNAYNADGEATDALNDAQTHADEGSVNPYRVGASRTAGTRGFVVTVLPDAPPADAAARAPNTLYVSRPRNGHVEIFYRLYVPDADRGVTGGVALPAVDVELADGSTHGGEDACAILDADPNVLPQSTTVPSEFEYGLLRDQPLQGEGYPAENPPVWHKYFNPTALYACLYFNFCGGQPADSGGIYNNIDNHYVYSYLSRDFGSVAVFRGRVPLTPATRDGAGTMAAAELRYWSLCLYETYTQRVQPQGCAYDETLPLDAQRYYTIVASSPEDRPANARPECGYGWLEWSPAGDGLNHSEDGLLLLRNMLPDAGFTQAVQNVERPGEEPAVMGEYLPAVEYVDKAVFEARGCG
ncbi:MAG: hypothetical protein VYC42_06710 [Pseudomonadota bacterium]|nr:hypothetical protein [Pseudomonadota bacterium]